MSEYYNRLAIHYAACNDIYYKCQDCEREFPIKRIFGKCSEHYVNLQRCKQHQRRIQQEENFKKSQEKRERFRQRLIAEKSINQE